LHAARPFEDTPSRGHRAEVIRISLVVCEDEATEAVARKVADDVDDHPPERRHRQRDRATPFDGERAHAVRERRREDGTIPRAFQMRRHSSGQLLAAEPIDQQREMWSVLLDGTERKKHDGARISSKLSGFGPRAFGESDHAGRRYHPRRLHVCWLN
jgi:hypothetical protein